MDLTLRIGQPSPPHEIPRMYIDSLELFPEESTCTPKFANHLFSDDVISSGHFGHSSEAPLPFPVSPSLPKFGHDRLCTDPPAEESRPAPVNFHVDCNIYGQNDLMPEHAEAPVQKLRNVDADYDATSDRSSAAANTNFDCNVCWEMAKEPVVTLFGHYCCRGCASSSGTSSDLSISGSNCPVYVDHVGESTLVPIYARGRFSNWNQEHNDDEAGLLSVQGLTPIKRKRKRACFAPNDASPR